MSLHSYLLAAGLGLLLLFLPACADRAPDVAEPGVDIHRIESPTGRDAISVGWEGGSVFFFIHSSSAWEIRLDPQGANHWLVPDVKHGMAGETAVSLRIAENEGAEREARIDLFAAGIRHGSLHIRQQSGDDSGGTMPAGEIIKGDVNLIECPQLAGGANNYFISHRDRDGKRITYSVEYDVERHNPRWVCFSFDDYSSAKHVSRTTPDPWDWDPDVPAQYAIGAADYAGSGFSRGHICASEDRVYSREANIQTFYYTNLMPQRYAFNAGVWLQLEGLVRGWGRSASVRDVMYVAKGGTIRDDQVEKQTANGKIPVPRYFWMALLLQKGEEWYAIAFWAEHDRPATVSDVKSLTISVDELERRTGIDFFHNLPDPIEELIEAQLPSDYQRFWPGL